MSVRKQPFRASWRSYLQALAAIARKDWIVYWRYPLSAVSSIFQPLDLADADLFYGSNLQRQGRSVRFCRL